MDLAEPAWALPATATLAKRMPRPAILQQIAANRGAVNGLMAEVLEGHLREHLGPDAADTLQRTDDLEQVISILHFYMK
jgi:DNA-binding FrmR family transcriptional regulator